MTTQPSFQQRVAPWLHACFGETVAEDVVERNFRFLEEAMELVQSLGMNRNQALRVLSHTFSRPLGEPRQEVGGVLVTLAALCIPHDIDMHEAGETELDRIWTNIDRIREKHGNKPRAIVSNANEDGGNPPNPFSDLIESLGRPESMGIEDQLLARSVIEVLVQTLSDQDRRIQELLADEGVAA